MAMKECHDGITRAWKVESSHEPFFEGGKIEIHDNMLVCMHDENLSIVDWSSSSSTKLLEDDEDSEEVITCFCCHPRLLEVVVATRSGLLRHWNYSPSEKKCLRTIRGHQMPVLSMCYDPTGTLCATGSADRSVRVWDIVRGYCTHSFRDHIDIVQRVFFHSNPNHLTLFSTSDDNTVRMYDLGDQKCVACFTDHMSLPTSLSVSDDGYMLVSAGRDKVINFYELRQHAHLKTVPVMDVLEGVVILSREDSRKLLKTFPAPTVDRTEYVVITAGEKGTLRIFRVEMMGKDVSSFLCQMLFQVPVNPIRAEYAVTADGKVPSAASLSSSKIVSTSALFAADATSSSAGGGGALPASALTGLLYLRGSGQVVVTTADQNICFFSIADTVESGGSEASLVMSKLLPGCNDDILDLACVPVGTGEGTEPEEGVPTPRGSYLLAVVTNSPQVRLMGGDMQCVALNGHTDIVLAVDCTLDNIRKSITCPLWLLRARAGT